MGYESKLSRRQEWSKQVGEIQTDVNEVLQDVQFEIEAANLQLSELCRDNPEEASEYAAEIIEYLDGLWKYHEHYFMVTGQWYWPSITISVEGIEAKQERVEAFTPARSNGFMIKPFGADEDEDTLRIGMSFILQDLSLSTPAIQGNFQVLAFAEPDTISLQYMRPGDSSVVSTDVTEVTNALDLADSLLNLHTNHASSRFYQLSRNRQRKFLRSIIDIVDNVLPAPDSMDRVVVNDLQTPFMFVRDPSNGKLVAISERNDRKMKISGEVVGVTIADMLHDGEDKRYENAEELDAAGSGLSLIVRPISVDFDMPEIMNQKEVLVPLRLAGSIPLKVI